MLVRINLLSITGTVYTEYLHTKSAEGRRMYKYIKDNISASNGLYEVINPVQITELHTVQGNIFIEGGVLKISNGMYDPHGIHRFSGQIHSLIYIYLHSIGKGLIHMRKLYKSKLEFEPKVGGAFKLLYAKPSTELPSTTTRSVRCGKLLQQMIPSLTEKQVKELADKIKAASPYVEEEKFALESVKIVPLHKLCSTIRTLGSCMHAHESRWKRLETYLHPAPTEIPGDAWSGDVGPASLIWDGIRTDGGLKELRAVLWPITNSKGEHKWFMDRVYPASPENRRVCSILAKKQGWSCNSDVADLSYSYSYTERAEKQLIMSVKLKKKLPKIPPMLPWLDTFCRVGDTLDTLITKRCAGHQGTKFQSNGLTTHGRWYTDTAVTNLLIEQGIDNDIETIVPNDVDCHGNNLRRANE